MSASVIPPPTTRQQAHACLAYVAIRHAKNHERREHARLEALLGAHDLRAKAIAGGQTTENIDQAIAVLVTRGGAP